MQRVFGLCREVLLQKSFKKSNLSRFVMVRRGDVYGFMVEHFAKQGQYKQVGVIINIENHFNAKKKRNNYN